MYALSGRRFRARGGAVPAGVYWPDDNPAMMRRVAQEGMAMAGQGTPEAIVRASVEAFNRHDLDGALAFLAPSGRWNLVGLDQSLDAEELRIAFWQYFMHDVRIEIRTMATVGNVVLCEYFQYVTEEEGTGHLVSPMVAVYTVDEGKIADVRQYYHPSWDRPAPA
jgi:limonene-1,2-epoxide hydrolase